MNEEIKNCLDELERIQGRFARIKDRLNLQTLGHHHLREGGDLLILQQSSFQEREERAMRTLENSLC